MDNYAALYTLCWSIASKFDTSYEKKEECVQEMMISLWENDAWELEPGFQYVIAKARAIDFIRKIAGDIRYKSGIAKSEETLYDERKEEWQDKTAIEELLNAKMDFENLEHFEFLLQYLQGYTFKQIGEKLGVTEGRISQKFKIIRDKFGIPPATFIMTDARSRKWSA
jgi:RNA polymerase sigma factor (sigma-70 family)